MGPPDASPSLSDPSASRAVLIGVSDYASLEPLPAVANNLRSLRELLTDPDLWGLPDQHCVTLLNPQSTTEVLEAIHAAAAQASDALLVYFAGHGLLDAHTADLYLSLPSTVPGQAFTAVRYDDVRRQIQASHCRRRVVILDSCYSGRALHDPMETGELALRASIEGTAVMTATTWTRNAMATSGDPYTAFTGALIDVLQHGISGGPAVLDLPTLSDRVTTHLRDLGMPRPQLRLDNDARSIAIVRNRMKPGHEATATGLVRQVAGIGFTVVGPPISDAYADILRVRDERGADGVLQIYRAGIQPAVAALRRLATVAPPSLLLPIEFGRLNDRPWELREHLPGGNLSTYLKAEPAAMALEQIARIVTQIAEGISALHQAGLVHRDLKPDNILIADVSTLSVRIADLGRSQELSALQLLPEDLPSADDWRAVGNVVARLATGTVGHSGPVELPRDVHPKVREIFAGLTDPVARSRWGAREIAEWSRSVSENDPPTTPVDPPDDGDSRPLMDHGDDDPRLINVWVQERQATPAVPLLLRQPYTFVVRVGDPVAANLAAGPRAIPRDAIPAAGLDTHWIVSSTAVALSPASTAEDAAAVTVHVANAGDSAQWMAAFTLNVPASHNSQERRLTIVPLVAGIAQIDVSISIDGDLFRQLVVDLLVEPEYLSGDNQPPPATPNEPTSGPVEGTPAPPWPDRGNAVTTQTVHGVPLRHTALQPATDWQSPNGQLDIHITHPQAWLRSDRLGLNTNAVWEPNCQAVEQQIARVRAGLDSLRHNNQEYFDGIDQDDLLAQLTAFIPPVSWTDEHGVAPLWPTVARSASLHRLAAEGYVLYELLFPRNGIVRAAIEALDPGAMLQITWFPSGSHIAHVPWALAYSQPPPQAGQPVDAAAFLGLRLRLNAVTHPMPMKSAGRALGSSDEVTRAHLLYWGRGVDDRVAIETRRHQARLACWKPLDLPSGEPAKPEVVQFLHDPSPSPVGLLYFYCRSLTGDGADPALRFGPGTAADDTVFLHELGVSELPGGPLVFANACGTSAGAPYIPNQLEHRFFTRGCRAFIGTESKVPIGLAARFGETFFHFLYETGTTTSAGEALAQARRFLWTEYGNIGGLFYSYVNDYHVYIASDGAVAALSAARPGAPRW
ncbi:caspase, EACC1-associated type [Dactylosporangium matsuzakiense]|uniref:Protein kinase domain-containing protein n=1 Tax=Dactylosporangium matsuzakiense TaxID=53360 RepID=A0A9W6KTB9_9ACTN|nr:CHAT domain-containing protein [Dactylosporangium matsuzakiense]GLL05139.1 hypothetical protein GCM10017581_068860 [Dactylosporangium matsuzakiense]